MIIIIIILMTINNNFNDNRGHVPKPSRLPYDTAPIHFSHLLYLVPSLFGTKFPKLLIVVLDTNIKCVYKVHKRRDTSLVMLPLN